MKRFPEPSSKIRITPLGKPIAPPTAILCPNCHEKSHFTYRTHIWDKNEHAWIIQECDACRGVVVAVFGHAGGTVYPQMKEPETAVRGPPMHLFPYFRPARRKPIPAEVDDTYAEATHCFSAGAYNAAAEMCRRAIQVATIKLGADPKRKLYHQIEELANNGRLEKRLVDLAYKIKELGDVPGAHPDIADLTREVKRKECAYILDFLEIFLDSAFLTPFKMKELNSKKSTTSAQ